jgi:hypothetical protein
MLIAASQHAATTVTAYVQWQLKKESTQMDRFFQPYNTPESEASRSKSFEGAPDPRSSLFNVLGWKK